MDNDAADHSVYAAVGKVHSTITRSERKQVIDQLKIALEVYEREVLQLYAVRVHLYNLYNHKIANGNAVSTFSRDFNMSIKGHNSKVEELVDSLMSAACKFDKDGKPRQAANNLLQIGLRYSVLYGDDVYNIVKACVGGSNKAAQRAADQMRWISKYRETLFHSVIKLSTNIAKKAWQSLTGDVVSESDLIHEAILAAREAVLNYQPGDDGKTFTSFVYNWVSGTISKFVNENTRTVSVPRTVLDRYRPILDVINRTPAFDYLDFKKIADEVNSTIGSSVEPYTEEEATKLHMIMEQQASLDLELTDMSLSDNLLDKSPNIEVQFDKKAVSGMLLGLLAEHCTEEEYQIMNIRWFGGRVIGLKQTSDKYTAITGKRMNKSKVAQLERSVFDKLHKLIDSGDMSLSEFMDTFRTNNDNEQVTNFKVNTAGSWCSGRRLVEDV